MKPPHEPRSSSLDQALAEFLASEASVGGKPLSSPAPRPARPSRGVPDAAKAPSPEGPAAQLLSAYQDVLEQEVERRKPRPAEQLSLWQRFAGVAVLLFMLAASGYVWFGHPAWLAPPPHTRLGLPGTALAGKRQLVAVALEVQDFTRSTGRVPRSLSEVGLRLDHVGYSVLPKGGYELRVAAGPQTIRLRTSAAGEARIDEGLQP